jgi:peptidoglycan/LPS O-acetylase OafA/YrhL
LTIEGATMRYPAVEGLRAVAALLVVLTHVAYWTGYVNAGFLGGLAARGDLGVAVFFVLSGVLLSRPWLEAALRGDPAPGLRRYAVHRASRLLPAYYLALAGVLLTAVLTTPVDGRDVDLTPSSLVSHLLLVQGITGPLLSTFSQTWSLTTELTFYLLLPVLAALAARAIRRRGPVKGVARVLACCVVGAGLGLLLTGLAAADVLPWSGRVALSAPAHAAWFASGLAVAALVAAEDTGALPGRRGATWQLVRTSPDLMAGTAAVLLLVAVTPVAGPRGFAEVPAGYAVAKELVYALVATAALLACISRSARGSATGRVLAGPSMRYLGRISYGIFLWHLLVMNWWYEVDPRPLFSGGFWVVLVATTTGSILVSSLSWFLVERRLIAATWKDKSPAQRRHGPERQDLGDVGPHRRLVGPPGSDDHQATGQQEPRTDHR